MTIEELDQIAESVRAANARFDYEVNVCMGTGCLSQHSDQLKDALNKEAEAQGKNALIRRTGCMGLCAAGPLVLCDPDEILYQHDLGITRLRRRFKAIAREQIEAAQALAVAGPKTRVAAEA